MATISIAPTPLRSTAAMNWLKSLKGVPGPHSPNLVMYAMFFGSLAPVALAYTTLALGSNLWISKTTWPVLVGFEPPVGTKFLARWHSSKIMQPSKSDLNQWTSCFKRLFILLVLEDDSDMSEEYVEKMTPFLTELFSLLEILAYLNLFRE